MFERVFELRLLMIFGRDDNVVASLFFYCLLFLSFYHPYIYPFSSSSLRPSLLLLPHLLLLIIPIRCESVLPSLFWTIHSIPLVSTHISFCCHECEGCTTCYGCFLLPYVVRTTPNPPPVVVVVVVVVVVRCFFFFFFLLLLLIVFIILIIIIILFFFFFKIGVLVTVV